MPKTRAQDAMDAAKAKTAQDINPSAGKAQETADDLAGRGKRTRKSAKQWEQEAAEQTQKIQDAETAELLQVLQVLGNGATMAIDNLFGLLDKLYEPAIQEIARQTGQPPPSMKLRADEKQLLGFTLERVIHKASPEWIAKYGIWLLVGLTTVTIGLPRIVIGLKLNKLTEDILRERATKKRHAQAQPDEKQPPDDKPGNVIPGYAAD